MIQRLNDKRRAAGENGFTLIELLVVIIILGILAAVVVFAVGGITDRGEESACRIDERTLRTAAEARYAQEGNYSATNPPDNGQMNVEAAYVTEGFLSEQSEYHDLFVTDTDSAVGPVVQGINVVEVNCP